jgi:hypothetical protein
MRLFTHIVVPAILLAGVSIPDAPPASYISPPSLLPSTPWVERVACCKICRKGKACGNSCIARNKTCHQPPGCACDAS